MSTKISFVPIITSMSRPRVLSQFITGRVSTEPFIPRDTTRMPRSHKIRFSSNLYSIIAQEEPHNNRSTTKESKNCREKSEASRSLKRGDIVDVVVNGIAYGGTAVGTLSSSTEVSNHSLDIAVSAPKGACPGDVIRCKVKKIRKNKRTSEMKTQNGVEKADSTVPHAVAEVLYTKMISPSPITAKVPCEHFGNFRLGGGGCGGCSSMHVPYAYQIQEKQTQMNKLFSKVAKENDVGIEPLIPSSQPLKYRNKMDFSFGRRWYTENDHSEKKAENAIEYALGLHAPQRFDKVVPIKQCHIQADNCNEILDFIRVESARLLLSPYDVKLNEGYLRNVVLRSSSNELNQQEIMVNIITNPCEVAERLKPLALGIVKRFPMVVCVLQNICDAKVNHKIESDKERLLAGSRSFIEQNLCGLVFRISANSFFQTNPGQAEVLYQKVQNISSLSHEDIILDLFCGTGSIGLSMASQVKEVHGIDIAESAIEDANNNAHRNQITNAHFHVSNLDKLKKGGLPTSLLHPSLVIVDPPRAGLHPDLIKYLSCTNAKRIIYVSCNPATQLRDIELLIAAKPGQFKLTQIQPVDMFPHTSHVECIVRIDRVQSE